MNQRVIIKGENMNGLAMNYVGGLLWGAGFLTAVVIFRVLLHVSICG